MHGMNEPRECNCISGGCDRMIEKSAYDQLREELTRAKAEAAFLSKKLAEATDATMKENERTRKTIRELLGEAVGEASMCWSETPKGIFDSTRAVKIVEELASHIEGRLRLESAIRGHMDALRPLLNEWSVSL